MKKIILLNDIFIAFKYLNLVKILTYLDFKRKYRRSVIGPFWSVISLALTIAIVSVVFGRMISTGGNNSLLYISIGLILWNFISTCLNESCDMFILNESIIKQIRIPFYIYSMRLISRNIILMLHNIFILCIVYIISPFEFCLQQINSIFGIFLVIFNLYTLATIIGILSTKFRDIGQLISNSLPLIFYSTPIIWSIDNFNLGQNINKIINLNPLYYFFEIIRNPLMCRPTQSSYYIITIIVTIVVFLSTLFLYEKYKNKIVYWL
jgi:lipopolysaccharide transport system permease protein